MKRYIINMAAGVEPLLEGPFKTCRERDRTAWRCFQEDEDNVVIWADVMDGELEVWTYPGGFSAKAQEATDDDESMCNVWTLTCPKCGKTGGLTVVEAVLIATGDIIRPNAKLSPDGFEVKGAPEELDDHSTRDEKVKCQNCDTVFALSDPALAGPDA